VKPHGLIRQGKGDLAPWMRLYASAYERATSMDLYPGSLNVLLIDPWELPTNRPWIATWSVPARGQQSQRDEHDEDRE
jgi:hypothetical protein